MIRTDLPRPQLRLRLTTLAAGTALLLAGVPASGESPGSRDAADPPTACYRAAVDAGSDVYPCDLAVQMARDGFDARELAAALANRAMVLLRAGRLQAALQDLDAAVQATPDNAQLHGNRGNLLLRLNRPTEALAAHDRAVALAPRDPASYYNRAFSYQALGDSPRASADVASAEVLLSGAPRAGGGASGGAVGGAVGVTDAGIPAAGEARGR
jgi:predicted Zn-dependent protease